MNSKIIGYVITKDQKLLMERHTEEIYVASDYSNIAKNKNLDKNEVLGGGMMVISERKIKYFCLYLAKEDDFYKAAQNSGLKLAADCRRIT